MVDKDNEDCEENLIFFFCVFFIQNLSEQICFQPSNYILTMTVKFLCLGHMV